MKRSGHFADPLFRLPWWANALLAVAAAVVAGVLLPRAFVEPGVVAQLGMLTAWIASVFFISATIGTAHLTWRRGELIRGDYRLRDLKNLTTREFQDLVTELYRKRGFKVEQRDGCKNKRKAKGRIDLVAHKKGRIALVRGKHSRHQHIDVTAVRELLGLIVAEKAHLGYLVSTEGFTDEAHAFAQKDERLRLITGCDLIRIMQSIHDKKMRLAQAPASSSEPYPADSRQLG